MDRTKQLGEDKISSLLIKFSIPSIVAMLVNALYNVIDRVFIGNSVGPNGIAGITLGFPIMLAMMGAGMLVGHGGMALTSIRLGQQKKEEAEVILGNVTILLAIVSVSITIVGLIFLDPLLRTFGASNEVLPYAKDYMSIILLGCIFQNLGFGLNSSIRAAGNPKKAMGTMLVGTILNIILAPIFIFGFKWGMRGAGLATVLAQAASTAWVLSHFLQGNSMLKIRIKNLKPKLSIVGSIFAIGIAPFAMQLAASLMNVILNKSLVAYGGDVAISGMGAVNSILTLVMMPIIGINQGAQPIIGYNYGAEKFDRVKQALKGAAIGATSICVVGFIMTRIFPTQLISLFNSQDKAFIAFGSNAMQIFLFCMPLIGFQMVGAGYFQAVGKPKQAMILTLSRQILFLIPILLILPRFYGMQGILLAGPIADVLSSLITAIWLYAELKHLNKKHEAVLILEQEEQSA